MPFITRQQIPEALRVKAEREHKTRLRSALMNPALTAEQKEAIRNQLSNVGKPRIYSASSPAKQGAIRLIASEPADLPVVLAQEPTAPEVSKEVFENAKFNQVLDAGTHSDVSHGDDGSGSGPNGGTSPGRRRRSRSKS